MASKAKGKGCMELGRDPGGIMGAPDMLGPVIVGMDMEGRDMGGPDTGGPGMRGTDDRDMGGRGIGAWEGTRGLGAAAEAGTEDTEGAWLDMEGGPGMVGMVGPGGGGAAAGAGGGVC